jgi:hypothetical protein
MSRAPSAAPIGLCGDAEALPRQFLHHDDEAAVLLAEQRIRRQAYVLEEQLCRVRGVLADLLDLAALLEAREAGVDQEQGRALGALARVRDRRDDDQVRVDAVGDENLGAVQDPLIAVADGVGADALHIRAGTGLGHRQGAESLAADHLRQPLLLLRLRAVAAE